MLKADMKSDIGSKRASNQDCAFYTAQRIGSFPNLFCVADGMGGHQAGDFASAFAIECIVNYIKKQRGRLPAAVLQEAFSYANKQLFQMASSKEELHGAGTTLVAVTVIGNLVYAANVGDSRLYMISDDEIRQITHDHSYVEELIAIGSITKDSEEYHRYKNVITRAIGTRDRVNADIFEVETQSYRYLLLCTDGLTNMVSDEVIRQIVMKNNSLEDKVEELVAVANENGGSDNITVVLTELDR